MIIYFVKNDKWYSKLMMWFEQSTMSHVGFGFFDNGEIVVDGTKPHSKLYHRRHWFTKYQPVQEIIVPFTPEIEKKVYKKVVDECLLKPYDWDAYAYAWLMAVANKLCGKAYPDTNPWSDPDHFWCTEIFSPILDELEDIGIDLTGVDLSIKTPQMIFDILKKQGW